MPRFEMTSILDATPQEVFDWHARQGALQRLTPPWQVVEIVGPPAKIEVGSRAELRLGRAPFATSWTAEHSAVEPGKGFVDTQVRGPFRRWVHQHSFEATDGGARCRLCDRIDYEIPAGFLGRGLAGRFIENSLTRAFDYRHRITAADLALHRRYEDARPLRVAITGSTGLIGSMLTAVLTTGGHEVIRLTRPTPNAGRPDEVCWDPEKGFSDSERLEGLDTVIHLAGESLFDRVPSLARGDRIRSSRLVGTQRLVEALGRLRSTPRTFLAASGTGYYESRGSQVRDEESGPGQGLLAQFCRRWEAEAARAGQWAERVIHARFGIVISPRGGVLARLLPAFRVGLGGAQGQGDQWMSWISIEDVVGALVHVLQTPRLSGAVNFVSPRPVTNREFVASLGRVLRRPAAVTLPKSLAGLFLGRLGREILLADCRVSPARLLSTGYPFRHDEIFHALSFLLGR